MDTKGMIPVDKLEIAKELRREGNIPESTKMLESIVDRNGEVYFECGWNYSIQANAARAIHYYELAIEKDLPGDLKRRAYMDLALNHLELQNFEKAEQVIDEGWDAVRLEIEAFRALDAIVNYKLGNYKEGMLELLQLLLEQSNNKELAKYGSEFFHHIQN